MSALRRCSSTVQDPSEIATPTEPATVSSRPSIANGARERRADAATRRQRRLGARDVLDQDQELVTAEAGRHVGAAQAVVDARGDVAEDPVAEPVAQSVVDRLEVVEVEEEDREELAAPQRRVARVA